MIQPQPRDRARERHARAPRSARTSTWPTRCSSATATTSPHALDLEAIASGASARVERPRMVRQDADRGRHHGLSGAMGRRCSPRCARPTGGGRPGRSRRVSKGIAWAAMEVARSNRGEVGEVNRFFAYLEDYSDSDRRPGRAPIYARGARDGRRGERRPASRRTGLRPGGVRAARLARARGTATVKWSYPDRRRQQRIAARGCSRSREAARVDRGGMEAAARPRRSCGRWSMRFRARLAPDCTRGGRPVQVGGGLVPRDR